MRVNEIFHRVLFTLKRRQMDRELAEEIRQHVELKTRHNLAAGMTGEEARYAAQRQLGNLTRMEEEKVNLTGPGAPEQISVATVATEFLPLLGVSPALGRGFQEDDEQRKSGDVALLSQRLWRERFASDPAIVGRSVTLEQKPYTI